MILQPSVRATLRALLLAAPLIGCAGAPARSGSGGDVRAATIAELAGQLKAQSALLSDQQHRIEGLEVRIAALASRLSEKALPKPASQPAKAAAAGSDPSEPSSGNNATIDFDGPAAPARSGKKSGAAADPREKLKTVKLEPEGAKGRRPRRNPVERAPRLPTVTNLIEPNEAQLARLDDGDDAPPRPSRQGNPGRDHAEADQSFARAVGRLNDGEREGAQADLLRFAARHPQHAAADNAIYLAGLASAQAGQCASAVPLFERVWADYPAGDAVPAARLEHARCLLKLGRGLEARIGLESLEKDHPDVPEASQARALLNGL